MLLNNSQTKQNKNCIILRYKFKFSKANSTVESADADRGLSKDI